MGILKSKWFKRWQGILWYKAAKRPILLAIFSIAGTTYLGAILPKLMMKLSRDYSDVELFKKHLISLSIIFVAIFLLRVFYQLAMNTYVRELVQNLRSSSFNVWLRSMEAYDEQEDKKAQYPLGEIIARLMNDTLAIRELVNSGAFSLIMDIFFVLSCLMGLVMLHGILGLLLSVVIILVTWLLIWGSDYMRVVFHDVRAAKGMVSRQMANVVAGFRETFFYPQSSYASRTGLIAYNNFLNQQLKANVWDASYYSLAESLYPILLAAMAISLPHLPGIESFLILALIDLIQRSINPIKSVAGKITNIQRAQTGLAHIEEFLAHIATLPQTTNEHFQSRGAFQSLTFKLQEFIYPRIDQRAQFKMQNISFTAKRGQMIGLVGPSGQGKSTLLKILSGILHPQQGEIVLSFDSDLIYRGGLGKVLEEYRSYTGLVSQDSHLFTESMSFNIILRDNLSDQEQKSLEIFWQSLSSQVPYIKKWQLQTKLSLNQLSAGEKQLVCAIRALYLQRPVVCFDEIASAMDSKLEEALRQSVLLVQSQSLTFIVAHRIETIIHADLILVIDKGRLVDQGSHGDLLENSLQYQEFVQQLKVDQSEHKIDAGHFLR